MGVAPHTAVTLPSHCAQALLSLAGFPALAGLDPTSRIRFGQFHAFQRHFRAAINLLHCAADLWNQTDPAIISGFDMDCRTAEDALASQPIGTFVCRLCMRQAGCLVLSCKVRSHAPPLSSTTHCSAHRALSHQTKDAFCTARSRYNFYLASTCTM